MKHKIQQLLELQLQKSLKHIEKNNSIEYNSLLDFVNENILKLSTTVVLIERGGPTRSL